jgi:hypothetical protein
MRAEPGSTKRAKPQALKNPSAAATAEEIPATAREFNRAEVSRGSFNTASYQRNDGPVKGGMGKAVDCSENTTSTTTGKNMKP